MQRARKRFGQHFLHDRQIIERIVTAIAPLPGEHLVEIGPGRGALTELLLRSAATLDIIEIDRELAAELRARHAGHPRLTIHTADALKFDFSALARNRAAKLRVIGNLPYNISTPLLFRLLEHRGAIKDLHVMLQKEVIDRICAAPDSADYGRLTVMLSPWLDTERLFSVGPGAFTPAPRVWSAVARLHVREAPRFATDARYAQVVAAAFSQRRKTLRNGLRALLDEAAIAAAGVDPGARAETLRPEQFAALANAVATG